MLEVFFEIGDLGYGLPDEKPRECEERWASEGDEHDPNEEDWIGSWKCVTMHIIGEHEQEVRDFQKALANGDSGTWEMLDGSLRHYLHPEEPVVVSEYFEVVHKYQNGEKMAEERVASTVYWEVYTPDI